MEPSFQYLSIAWPPAILVAYSYIIGWWCLSVRPCITISTRLQGLAFASSKSIVDNIFQLALSSFRPSDNILFQEVILITDLAHVSVHTNAPLLWCFGT